MYIYISLVYSNINYSLVDFSVIFQTSPTYPRSNAGICWLFIQKKREKKKPFLFVFFFHQLKASLFGLRKQTIISSLYSLSFYVHSFEQYLLKFTTKSKPPIYSSFQQFPRKYIIKFSCKRKKPLYIQNPSSIYTTLDLSIHKEYNQFIATSVFSFFFFLEPKSRGGCIFFFFSNLCYK